MHLCFDYSAAAQQGAGIGRYGREMLPRLRSGLSDADLSVFYNNAGHVSLPPAVAELRTFSTPLNNKLWRLHVWRDYLLGGKQDARFPGVDLFFAADHLLPRFEGVASIINIRDLSYLILPRFHTRFSRVFQRLLMPRFARQASHIIVPSNATRHDLTAHYHVPGDRITVVAEGVDDQFRRPVSHDDVERVRRHYDLPNPYLLYIGTLEPRKNVKGLLDAFAALLQTASLPTLDLVLAGGLGWLYEETLRHITTLGIASRVRRIGYVANEELPALYRGAEVFAFPSWYEGFGLPPLEALASGTPVVSSNAASLPEVVGDAGLLVAPEDTAGLTHALKAVLDEPDLNARLRAAGPRQAASYTWERTANQTLELCRKVHDARRH